MDDDHDYDFRKMDNIRVIGRFRPASNTEKLEEKSQGLSDDEPELLSSQQVRLTRKDGHQAQPFDAVLDYIFPMASQQKHVFNKVGRPMVQAVLEGYNATIFAYGQTGSGKTFTMFGPEKRKDDSELGLVPRCCTYLFQQVKKQLDDPNGTILEWQVNAEFIQIYKEQLLDLLDPKKIERIQIRTNFETDTPYVENLKSVGVTSPNEILMLLSEAQKNRIVASHKLNAESSRSHMLVMLTLEQKMKDGAVKRSKLNFGDLAGSEDIRKALGDNPDPERLKEAIGINSSLSALTTAINCLSKNTRPSYRSSALTHILQESLGGNSKTTMMVNCSPHVMNRSETIRTLRFALTAKEVKNKARVNELETRAQLIAKIQRLEAENRKLKTKVIELETKLLDNGIQIEISKELYETKKNRKYSDESDSDDEQKKPPIPSVNNAKNGKVESQTQPSIKQSQSQPQIQPLKSEPKKLQLSMDTNINANINSQQNMELLIKQMETMQKNLDEEIKNSKKKQDQISQQEIELQQLMDELNKARLDRDEAIENNKKLNKDKKTIEERFNDVSEQLKNIQNRKHDETGQLDKQIERLRQNLQMQLNEKKQFEREMKELKLENEEIIRENKLLKDQLNDMKSNYKNVQNVKQDVQEYNHNNKALPPPPSPQNRLRGMSSVDKNKNNNNNHNNNNNNNNKNNDVFELTEEEKKMSPADFLLTKFADAETADFRLTNEQKMQKTSHLMKDLSTDINSLMDAWLPKGKVLEKRKQGSSLVYQVRQLIGHFNVAVQQLKQQEESYQNDLKLQLQRKDKEIKQLQQDNKRVLQLQDDIADKDDIITQLRNDIHQLKTEKDQLEIQSREAKDMLGDVQEQVVYLEHELDKNRSELLNNSDLKKLVLNHQNSLNQSKNNKKGLLNKLKDSKNNNEDDDEDEEDEKEISPPPKSKKHKKSAWRDGLKKEDRCDAKDSTGLWWSAKIIETRGNQVKVRYDGWGDKHDDWIDLDSDRIGVYKQFTAIEQDDKRIIREGHMYKEGKMFHTWRKRWFVLDDQGNLSYYDNRGDKDQIGSFNIKDLKQTSRVSFGKTRNYGLQVETGDRVWKFVCEDEKELIDWIHAINFVKNGVFSEDEDEE